MAMDMTIITAITITGTTMIEARAGRQMAEAQLKLMTWLSPSYPVGAFSYSHGVEHAVDVGLVADRSSAERWIGDIVAIGSGRADAAILAAAYAAFIKDDAEAIVEVAEFAAAFAPSAEIRLETTAQGQAFLSLTRQAWPAATLERLAALWPGPYAYPVAVAAAAAGHGVPPEAALAAYLHAFAANLVSAAVRLVPLGQSDGQAIQAALAPLIVSTAEAARAVPLDAVASATFAADIGSMRHETQYSRLFRS